LIIIRNISWASNNHIRIVSDTEDWSNDAENSALHHRNKLHFTIYSNRKQLFSNCNNISQYNCITIFFLYFLKCSLGERKRLKKHWKHYMLCVDFICRVHTQAQSDACALGYSAVNVSSAASQQFKEKEENLWERESVRCLWEYDCVCVMERDVAEREGTHTLIQQKTAPLPSLHVCLF